jgi:hypothetical protein
MSAPKGLVGALLLGLMATLSACALHGPALTPTSHLAYNEAVQQSERRELLLNLVRLRYLERPEFLTISSISSQMQFDARASISADFGDDQRATTRLITPGGGVGYSESPTVTFAPQRGDDFTRRLVVPVDLDKLYLLTRYGWSLERTLRLVAEQVNDLRNVASRETFTAEDVESIERFAEVARTMESLYARHVIDIESIDQWIVVSPDIPADRIAAQDFVNAAAGGFRLEYDSETAAYELQMRILRYVLRVAPEGRGLPELDALRALLGLSAGESAYELDSQRPSNAVAGSVLAVRTRSVLGVMAYLSHGVAVPAADLASGAAGPSELKALANRPLIRILSSNEQPAGAALAVEYRGHWFYIEDRDLDSRRTLGALDSLVRLQIGAGGAQSVPVLTLPVAR